MGLVIKLILYGVSTLVLQLYTAFTVSCMSLVRYVHCMASFIQVSVSNGRGFAFSNTTLATTEEGGTL